MKCPTCSGTGSIEPGPEELVWLPGLEEALSLARVGGRGAARVSQCTMCIVIAHAAPGEARDALIHSAAGRMSARALRLTLHKVGIQIGREAISLHRNEDHRP